MIKKLCFSFLSNAYTCEEELLDHSWCMWACSWHLILLKLLIHNNVFWNVAMIWINMAKNLKINLQEIWKGNCQKAFKVHDVDRENQKMLTITAVITVLIATLFMLKRMHEYSINLYSCMVDTFSQI